MLENSLVVYLQVPFEVLISRIGADPGRPLWRNAESLFLERQEAYSQAHISVGAAAPPDDVAAEIVRLAGQQHLASLNHS
jgi:shikimate kinase